MKLSRHSVSDYRFVLALSLVALNHVCFCQLAKPGLPGMAPSKFLTIRHTQAPGRSLQTSNGSLARYNQEDLYFKAWVPLMLKSGFYILAAPQYRTEQLEFNQSPSSEVNAVSHWNLRSMALDLRTCYHFDSASWFVGNININRSGNLADVPDSRIPVSVTATALFLNKRSARKEVGYGLMVSKGYNRFNALPVLVFNYNFSATSGVEISLPHKIAWRRNITPNDIFYVKADASSRTYTLRDAENRLNDFRRTDVDLGVAYNRSLGKYAGLEISSGYRRNLKLELPCNSLPVNKSGLTFMAEFYVKPPLKSSKK
ncbi:hypothetical protein KK083_04305 [Fulvivirgaceae bacterium PWU4]|uniref:PorT family protein n=1 Tax=Chryseosolibacter histidini TaxID=2782349 RepID=A0AAP2GMR3_9BACT|nr:DUF6268 family outer membrane beta-barrel protein [Chryseosolibacter histidini]MBT1696085.1 hypothetical protein [Chryseosolibacter histidini]